MRGDRMIGRRIPRATGLEISRVRTRRIDPSIVSRTHEFRIARRSRWNAIIRLRNRPVATPSQRTNNNVVHPPTELISEGAGAATCAIESDWVATSWKLVPVAGTGRSTV
jgi:hypothetical protein